MYDILLASSECYAEDRNLRTKDLIADQLPKKIDNIVFCPLSDDQKQAYKRLLTHPELEIIMQHDEPCPCGKTDSEG